MLLSFSLSLIKWKLHLWKTKTCRQDTGEWCCYQLWWFWEKRLYGVRLYFPPFLWRNKGYSISRLELKLDVKIAWKEKGTRVCDWCRGEENKKVEWGGKQPCHAWKDDTQEIVVDKEGQKSSFCLQHLELIFEWAWPWKQLVVPLYPSNLIPLTSADLPEVKIL